jgi:hypothetical protein
VRRYSDEAALCFHDVSDINILPVLNRQHSRARVAAKDIVESLF